MTNISPRMTDGPRLALPTGVEVASYDTYEEAQRAVDHLSDNEFPVQKVWIVGTDLRMVEKVLGRLTYGRVAGGGAMNGAWFGLLIGLLFMIFMPGGWVYLLAAVLLGAAFGLLAGLVGFALRSRDRDFTSTSQVVASRYAIVSEHAVAGQVEQSLRQAGLLGRTPRHDQQPVQGVASGQRRTERVVPEGEPQYGIRLEGGQAVEDVTGRPENPEQGAGPRD